MGVEGEFDCYRVGWIGVGWVRVGVGDGVEGVGSR